MKCYLKKILGYIGLTFKSDSDYLSSELYKSRKDVHYHRLDTFRKQREIDDLKDPDNHNEHFELFEKGKEMTDKELDNAVEKDIRVIWLCSRKNPQLYDDTIITRSS